MMNLGAEVTKNEGSFQVHINPAFVITLEDEVTPAASGRSNISFKIEKEVSGNDDRTKRKTSGGRADHSKPEAIDPDLEEKKNQASLPNATKQVTLCPHARTVFCSIFLLAIPSFMGDQENKKSIKLLL